MSLQKMRLILNFIMLTYHFFAESDLTDMNIIAQSQRYIMLF